jgi:uroporphyrinogen decarboxylase
MSVEKEFLLDSGIDGYHAIEPLAGMDIFYLKEKYGKNITLLGNVDCSELLISGTRKEIEDNVKKLVTKCKNGGGYILSSSNSIHDGVSLENYKVMINAGKEYGKY